MTITTNKKIYVCSALRGDVDENIKKAKTYCEYIVREHGALPIAPHIYFTQFLDDNNENDREFGIRAGLSLLSGCDELWYFGESVSRGMADEICFAVEHKIPVKYIPIHHYENYLQKEGISYEIH